MICPITLVADRQQAVLRSRRSNRHGAQQAAREVSTMAVEPEQGGMQGRTVLVTGATRGIGYETARALARSGARVIITGRDAGSVIEVSRSIGPTPLVTPMA
jgi:FlaA1/EpsC-like NDP-sugar epimerase